MSSSSSPPKELGGPSTLSPLKPISSLQSSPSLAPLASSQPSKGGLDNDIAPLAPLAMSKKPLLSSISDSENSLAPLSTSQPLRSISSSSSPPKELKPRSDALLSIDKDTSFQPIAESNSPPKLRELGPLMEPKDISAKKGLSSLSNSPPKISNSPPKALDELSSLKMKGLGGSSSPLKPLGSIAQITTAEQDDKGPSTKSKSSFSGNSEYPIQIESNMKPLQPTSAAQKNEIVPDRERRIVHDDTPSSLDNQSQIGDKSVSMIKSEKVVKPVELDHNTDHTLIPSSSAQESKYDIESDNAHQNSEIVAKIVDEMEISLNDTRRALDRYDFNNCSQRLNASYQFSIRIDPEEVQSQLSLPLHTAILFKDFVAIDMILNQSSEEDIVCNLLACDNQGRNAFHIVCLTQSTKLFQSLMSYYSNFHSQLLQSKLDRLQREHEQYQSMTAKQTMCEDDMRRIEIVNQWYRQESIRLSNVYEIDVEHFYCKAMSARDYDGRTPYHYAVAVNCSETFLKKLLSFPLPTGLQSNAIYEISSGNILAMKNATYDPMLAELLSDKTAIMRDSSNTLLLPMKLSMTKLSAQKSIIFQHRSESESKLTSDTMTMTSIQQPAVKRLNYDIIIPWLVRNIMRQCNKHTNSSSSSSYNRSIRSQEKKPFSNLINPTTGFNLLKSLISRLDSDSTGLLLVHEVKKLLSMLELHATSDVIREFCHRYPADIDETKRKFQHSKLRYEESLQTDMMAADRKYFEKVISDLQESLDVKSSAASRQLSDDIGAKSDSKPVNRMISSQGKDGGIKLSSTTAATMSFAGDKATKATDMKSSSLSTSQSLTALLDRGNSNSSHQYIHFDSQDETVGLDISLLLDDIQSEKGFKSIEFPSAAAASSSTAETGNLESSDRIVLPSTEFSYPPIVSLTQMSAIRNAILDISDSCDRTCLYYAVALGSEQSVKQLMRSSSAGHQSMGTVREMKSLNIFNASNNKTINNMLEKHLVNWLETAPSSSSSLSATATSLSQSLSLPSSSSRKNVNDAAMESQLDSSSNSMSEVFNSLLPHIENLQSKNWSYSRSPLAWAASKGLLQSVKHILSHSNTAGGDTHANYRDLFGRTALHECSSIVRLTNDANMIKSAILICEQLFEHQIDPNIRSISGRNCLHELFCKNQDESQKQSSSSPSPSLNSSSSSGTAVSTLNTTSSASVLSWKKAYMRNLFQWKVKLSDYDRHGMTPLHYCVRENAMEMLIEVFQYGQQQQSTSRLIHCTDDGDNNDLNEMTPSSEEDTINIQIKTKTTGNTILHIACTYRYYDLIHLMMRWDADYIIVGNHHLALARIENNNGKPPKLLYVSPKLFHGEKKEDIFYDSVWHAAYDGSLYRLRSILESDRYQSETLSSPSVCDSWLECSIHAKSRVYKWTCLHACILGLADLSIAYHYYHAKPAATGQKPDYTNYCAIRAMTELYGVKLRKEKYNHMFVSFRGGKDLKRAEQEFINVIRFLIQAGIDMDAHDSHGRTALFLAAACNFSNICQILLDAKATAECTDYSGDTIPHITERFNCVKSSLLFHISQSMH